MFAHEEFSTKSANSCGRNEFNVDEQVCLADKAEVYYFIWYGLHERCTAFEGLYIHSKIGECLTKNSWRPKV